LSAKNTPRKTHRIAPAPPLAPGETADTGHQQACGHGHEHQIKPTENSQTAAPKSAN